MPLRLQKIIADAGLASRREAERLIEAGKVSVNGVVVRKLGTTADPRTDTIKVKGRRLPPVREKVYVLFNKPRGCLTTVRDDRNRKTVMDYFKKFPVRLFPVGRLDFNTQGVLLLTNDGELARQLLDPRNQVERTYQVKVHGIPDERDLQRLRRGVTLDGVRTGPIRVTLDRTTGRSCYLTLVLTEGKYRHIKRACEQVGHPVVKLTRTGFGNLTLSGLPAGAFRLLTPREVKRLRRLIHARPAPDAA